MKQAYDLHTVHITHALRVSICCHNTDYIHIYGHDRTVLVILSTVQGSWAGSSIGIASELRAGLSGIECRWGRDFPPVQTGTWDHLASCTMGTGSFPRVKCYRGVLLTTHTLLVPGSWKGRAIPLPTLWATPGL